MLFLGPSFDEAAKGSNSGSEAAYVTRAANQLKVNINRPTPFMATRSRPATPFANAEELALAVRCQESGLPGTKMGMKTTPDSGSSWSCMTYLLPKFIDSRKHQRTSSCSLPDSLCSHLHSRGRSFADPSHQGIGTCK